MIKNIYVVFVLLVQLSKAQTIDVPKGVAYKYASDDVNKKAEKLIRKELSSKTTYSLYDKSLFIGSNLWDRYKNDSTLYNIEGGNLQLQGPVYNAAGEKTGTEIKIGKFIQDKKDFKKVWDYLIKECSGQQLIVRKLTRDELAYYWSVIPYDIEEPIFSVETKEHIYIIDIDKNKLIWLDGIK